MFYRMHIVDSVVPHTVNSVVLQIVNNVVLQIENSVVLQIVNSVVMQIVNNAVSHNLQYLASSSKYFSIMRKVQCFNLIIFFINFPFL